MTLSSTTVKTSYNGDGSTKAFATGFIFWNSSEVEAILVSSSGNEETWTEGTQYSVTGGGGATGTVTASTTPTDYTPASGTTLVLKSNVRDIQGTSLPAGGAFPSTSVEQELDRIVRRIQQKAEELDRSLTLSEASTFSSLELPDPEANKVLRWNSSGDTLENATMVGSSAITTPVAIADGGTGSITATAALTALLASAGAIPFPATQVASSGANDLDDYEEGTWTPTLTFATPGNLSVAYTSQDGYYTKIGRMVLATCGIVTSTFTHTTASGNCQVTGLPFSVGTGVFMAALHWQGITKANYTDINTQINSTTIVILEASGSAQGASPVAAADMPTAGTVHLRFTAPYHV